MNNQMWYIAAKYPSEKLAGDAYFPLQTMLKTTAKHIDMSVYRIMIYEDWHILIIGENELPSELNRQIHQHLAKGKIVEVRIEVLQRIAMRRDENLSQAKRTPDNTLYTEKHNRVPLSSFDTPFHTGITFKNVGDGSLNTMVLRDETKKLAEVSQKFLDTLRGKPFVIAYQMYTEEIERLEWKEILEELNAKTKQPSKNYAEDEKDVINYLLAINMLKIRRSQKYLFSSSAISLHSSVMSQHNAAIQLPDKGMHVWIETHVEQSSPYGNFRAMFFHDAFPLDEIAKVTKGRHDSYERMVDTMSVYNGKLGLLIVNDKYDTMYDFTFDRGANQWVFLPSHKCPVGKCVYPKPTSVQSVILYEAIGNFTPCDHCLAACNYFGQWLNVALAMIAGDYSYNSDDVTFKTEKVSYSTKEYALVGKGKNQRKVLQDTKRDIEYTMVTYDLNKRRRLTEDEQNEIQETRKANWLVTTSEGDIIWVKRKIKAYSRRFPTKKDGTRNEGVVTIKNDFIKRVPMLAETKHTKITKVVASEYQDRRN